MLAKRAVNGALPIIAAARKLQDELLTPTLPEPAGDDPLDDARRAVASLKKTALMVLGTAMQTYGAKLADEQEVLTLTADIIIDVFAAESALLRGAAAKQPLHQTAARLAVDGAAGRVELAARAALAAMSDGDTRRTLLAALRRVMKVAAADTIALRRQLADAVADRRVYPF
jgi:hypothetical protein